MSGITPELLLRAYARGLFPMAEDRHERGVFWVDPELRGVLPLDGFHVPRRLARAVRRDPFEVRADTAFDKVIRACAGPAPARWSSWINDDIIALYGALHRMGFAHSVECWREGRLTGGLYGVALGAGFFGESMFSAETDASKIALVHLVARLRHGGYVLLDTQFVTRHLASFGAIEVPRHDYRELLDRALESSGDFDALPQGLSGGAILQSMTQTS